MILGIDPGLSGALAFMDSHDLLIYDIPTLQIERNGKSKRQIDLQHLLADLKRWPVSHCYLEMLGTRPGQNSSAVAQTGRGYGQIEMGLAACNIPVTYVAPQVWKKALQVPKDKDGARARASQLLPQWAHNWPLKGHHNRAEAALLSLYGFQKRTRNLSTPG